MKKILLNLNFTARCTLLLLCSILFALPISAQVTVTIDGTDPSCGGFTNGTATANPSGGWEPYTFEWSNGETTQTIYGLAAGTYSVTATDMDGGYNVATITLSTAAQTDAEITVNNICAGNGNVTIETSGGVPPYTYNWSDGGSGSTRVGLDTETQYCVTVLDDNLCGVVTCAVIPEAISIDVTATGVACAEDCDGSVVADITGGKGPFDILWSNGVTSSINGNLPVGTYTVTVTDSNGCSATGSGTVSAPTPVQVSISASNPTCGANGTGSATAAAFGGTPGYTYEWSNGANSATVTGLSFGTYTVTATDANGCEGEETVIIEPSAQLALNISSNNPTCANPNGGSATVNVFEGTAPYSYVWNTGSNAPTITGLDAGVYSVTVSDAVGCSNSTTITLSQDGDTIFANVEENDASCGLNNGSATAQGSGGSGAYSYSWSTGQNTQTINNLGAGTYTVTIIDNQSGCTAAKTVFISNTSAVNASLSTMNATCSSNNGTAGVNAFNGTPPYTYAWNTGATASMITGLNPGTYTVTVTDANGCTDVESGVVGSNNSDIIAASNAQAVSCFGGNDGSVGLSVSGGVTPYSFAWNTGQSSPSLNNLFAGNYTVTITDAAGCTEVTSAVVTQPSAIALNINNTSAGCAGGSIGTATASVTGGTPPYSYVWSNGGNGSSITGLTAGTYTVTVTDQNGCTASTSTNISQNSAIDIVTNSTAVNCNGGSDGTASAAATGGNAPYNYTWSNGASGATITGLNVGTYTVTATDQNGCTETASVFVALGNNANLTCNVITISPVSTNNGTDGVLSANVSGGSGNYNYNWSNGANTQAASGLAAGTYSVTVTDNNTACVTVCSGTLTNPAALGKIGDKVFFDINIDGNNDDVDYGVAGVSVALTGTTAGGAAVNQSTETDANGMYLFDDLPAGTYKLTFSNLPADATFTTQNSGDNEETDSDVDVNTGMTAFFDLAEGECNLSIDAGITNSCACDNFTDPGVICCDQTACGTGYDPAPIVSASLPSGGSGGPIEYLWMKKEGTGPFNSTQVQAIPNSNSPTFDPGPLYVTTTYYRCTRRGECCPYIEGEGVTIFINEDADASFTGPADNILCQGETYTYTANTISSTATYTWTIQGNPVTTDTDEPSIEVVWSSNGFYDVMLTVNDNACTASTLDNRLVTNSPDYCGQGVQGLQGLVIDATVIHSKEVELELIAESDMEAGLTYTLERSKNGVDFEEIEAVEMSSNYTQTSDFDPLRGRSFYRVKMSNVAGDYGYSNVEEISIFYGNENTLVYPNPFVNEINYEIKDTFGEEVILQIISPDGRVIRSFTTDKDTFYNTLNVSDLPRGVYFLRFNFSSIGVQTYKMMKQ